MKLKIPSDCGQFILPVNFLQKMTDKKYTLLDVGGGEHLLKRFLPNNIEYKSLDYTGEQDYTHNLDVFPIPIPDNSFDIILCLESLEHTMYPHKIMKELLRIAKPNAIFFISIPNEYNFLNRIYFLCGKKTDVQEPFRIVSNHHHIHLPRIKDTKNLLSNYVNIEKTDYPWYSRHSGYKGFIGKISNVIDKIINVLAKIYPSMFARTIVVIGSKR